MCIACGPVMLLRVVSRKWVIGRGISSFLVCVLDLKYYANMLYNFLCVIFACVPAMLWAGIVSGGVRLSVYASLCVLSALNLENYWSEIDVTC